MDMMRPTLTLVAAGAAVLALSVPTARADIVIDNFSNTSQPVLLKLTESSPGPAGTDVAATGTISGQRTILVRSTSFVAGQSGFVEAVVNDFNPFSYDSGNADGLVQLFYNTSSADLSGETGIDINVTAINFTPVPVTVTLTNPAGDLTLSGQITGTGTTYLPFADGVGSGGLSGITEIIVGFDPPEEGDINLGSIRAVAVPEPVSLALLGLGGVLVLISRKVSRRQITPLPQRQTVPDLNRFAG